MTNFYSFKSNNPREIALFLLLNIQNDNFNTEKWLNIFKKNHILLKEEDINLVIELVKGVIKHLITLDNYSKYLITKKYNKLPYIIVNVLRLGIYQIKFLESIPNSAAVNESVKLSKKFGHSGTSKLTNAVLRNFIRKINILDNEIESKLSLIEKIEFKYSLPLWILNYWKQNFTLEDIEKISINLMDKPKLFFRINTLKISPKDLKNEFHKQNIIFNETIFEDIIEVFHKGNPISIFGYNEGYWYIQDFSSALLGKVLNPKKENKVIEFCSFPGGKTTHISSLMKNTGRIIAIDSNENRKIKFIENINRLGCNNIETRVQLAQEKLNIDFLADKILVDPPCSGLGVIKRKPEIKFNKNFKDIERLSELQLEILNNASMYLKHGGELVYSTCTISYKENEKVINQFLEYNKNFKLVPLNIKPFENEKFINILPFTFNSDGFFIAKIQKL